MINGIIVQNNPVNYFDPEGLWSFSLSGYFGWGGGLTFGRNPDGTFFGTARGGYGIGGGWSYAPNGKSPGYDPCKNRRHEILLGGFIEGEAAIGPFYAGAEANAGVRIAPRGNFRDYYATPIAPKAGFRKGWSQKLGAASGGEVTFYY